METQTDRMKAWLSAEQVELDDYELKTFNRLYQKVVKSIWGWSEDDLKMKFISGILPLGYMDDTEKVLTYFEKTIFATIDGHFLSTKSDFMMAIGILDMPEKPFFHFQEYKPHKKTTGDSMAQLLEAMLIAQHQNNNENPIYGCEVMGEMWRFVILEGKSYCTSKAYDCTDREKLLQIIAILRKFRYILETELLDKE